MPPADARAIMPTRLMTFDENAMRTCRTITVTILDATLRRDILMITRADGLPLDFRRYYVFVFFDADACHY